MPVHFKDSRLVLFDVFRNPPIIIFLKTTKEPPQY